MDILWAQWYMTVGINVLDCKAFSSNCYAHGHGAENKFRQENISNVLAGAGVHTYVFIKYLRI